MYINSQELMMFVDLFQEGSCFTTDNPFTLALQDHHHLALEHHMHLSQTLQMNGHTLCTGE